MLGLTLLLLAAEPSAQDARLQASADAFSVEGLGVWELRRLRAKIDDTQPSVGGPVLQIAFGAPLTVFGATALALVANGAARNLDPWVPHDPLGGRAALTTGGYATLIGGLVVTLFGAALFACGIIRLSRYLPQRRLADYKLGVIDRQLEAMGVDW
jgi:hypothetical protein